MTDDISRGRINAIGRIAILTSESESAEDEAVEVATADARVLLEWRIELAEKLAVATRTVASLAAQRDAMEVALNKANDTVHRVSTVRCWENEDRRWFAFRDDLYEALHGEPTEADGPTVCDPHEPMPLVHRYGQPEKDLRAARDMLRRPEPYATAMEDGT